MGLILRQSREYPLTYSELDQNFTYLLDTLSASISPVPTASYALNAATASYAENSNLLNGLQSSIFATTGSNFFKGNQQFTGSIWISGDST